MITVENLPRGAVHIFDPDYPYISVYVDDDKPETIYFDAYTRTGSHRLTHDDATRLAMIIPQILHTALSYAETQQTFLSEELAGGLK